MKTNTINRVAINVLRIALVAGLGNIYGCRHQAMPLAQPLPVVTPQYDLSGNGFNQPTTPPQVEIKDDQFEKNISFKGIVEKTNSNSASLTSELFLRSWLNKDTWLIRHQVYWADSYYGSGWRFWFIARDENATNLELMDISKDVGHCSSYGGCSHYETIGIMVSDATLRAKRTTGLQIKVKARDGSEQVLSLSPAQIDAQLTAIASKLPKNVKPLEKTDQSAKQRPKKRRHSH